MERRVSLLQTHELAVHTGHLRRQRHQHLSGCFGVACRAVRLFERDAEVLRDVSEPPAFELFEDLARENSIDPFYAPNGGDLGVVEEGSDVEYDEFFATMEVGDIKYFRSLEGHLIMWLRERRKAGIPAFEEARDDVVKDLRPAYKDQILIDWIGKRRVEVGVKINSGLLEEIELGS